MTAAAKNNNQQSLYQFNTNDLSSFSSEASIKHQTADIYDVYDVEDVTPKHMIGFNLKKTSQDSRTFTALLASLQMPRQKRREGLRLSKSLGDKYKRVWIENWL